MSIDNENSKNIYRAESKKCTSCGAYLVFDPEYDCLSCEHCGCHYGIKKIPLTKKLDFIPSALSEEKIVKSNVAVKCLNCGAVEIMDSSNMSHTCSFCGSTKINSEIGSFRYEPDAIVPFSINRNYVEEKFAYWVKKRKFVPRKFKKIKEYDSFSPVYIPCWVFDSQIKTYYDGVLGHNIEVEHVDSTGRYYTQTETEYFDVSGEITNTFNNLVTCGDGTVSLKNFEGISPFNFDKLRVYNDDYIAGCMANQYSIDIKTSWNKAYKKMDSEIRSNILSMYQATTYKYLLLDKKPKYTKFAYTLLPAWKGDYTYNGKKYNVYVNGTNGKFYGEVPRKTWLIILIIILFVALIIIGSYALTKSSVGGFAR